MGMYGTSTTAAPVLGAAAACPAAVQAIVVRGGRPDLAGRRLEQVHQPTLLIVGGNDPSAQVRARETLQRLPAEGCLEIVSGASYLFNEPGALEQAALLAIKWFLRHLKPAAQASAR